MAKKKRPTPKKNPPQKSDDVAILRRQVAERELELEILATFSKSIWSTLDHHTLSQHLFEMLKKRVDVHALILFLVRDDGHKLLVASHHKVSPADSKTLQSHAIRHFLHHAGRKISPQSVSVALQVVKPASGGIPKVRSGGVRHIHSMPLAVLDKIHGLLGLAFSERHPLTKEDEQFVGIVANEVAMMAEHQRIQSELVRERNVLESILHSMTCAVVVVDAEQKVFLTNPLANAILGLRSDLIANRPIAEVVQLEPILSLFKVASQGSSEYLSGEIEIPNVAQGRNMTAKANLAKVRNRSGQVVGAVMVLNDVTREKEIERARTEFVSVASHELRTPMAAIREAVALIMEGITGSVNEKQLKFLDMARRNIDRLTGIINDLLDLSKIESGKLVLTKAMTDPFDIIEDVFATFEPMTQEKGLSLLKLPRDHLPKVMVDRDKMDQVMGNLVANAVKFTPAGGMITIGARNHPGRQKDIEFFVQDTGIGIEKKDFSKLFQKFQQLDSSLSRVAGGTGLGLAISKEIAELHGGRIWVESELGKGSTFRVLIPIEARKSMRKRYVLTVTSNRELEGMIRGVLEKNNFEMGHVFRGGEVMPSIQEMRPNLIILDSRIPDIRGFELCRQLREDSQSALVPIVLITAPGDESAVWEALSLGVNGYLIQPVDAKAILSTVCEVIQ